MNALLIEKLKNYQGSLLSSKWKIPQSKRQFSFALNRIIKLFYAMENRKLFYPELVREVKGLAIYFKIFMIKNRSDKVYDFLPELEKIIEFEVPIHFERIEKVRVQETKRCSVCRVNLTNPAYLIYRTEEGTEVRSEPTGIFCLKQLHGYLEDFKESLKVAWEIKEIGDEVTQHGKEALRVAI